MPSDSQALTTASSPISSRPSSRCESSDAHRVAKRLEPRQVKRGSRSSRDRRRTRSGSSSAASARKRGRSGRNASPQRRGSMSLVRGRFEARHVPGRFLPAKSWAFTSPTKRSVSRVVTELMITSASSAPTTSSSSRAIFSWTNARNAGAFTSRSQCASASLHSSAVRRRRSTLRPLVRSSIMRVLTDLEAVPILQLIVSEALSASPRADGIAEAARAGRRRAKVPPAAGAGSRGSGVGAIRPSRLPCALRAGQSRPACASPFGR